MSVNAGQFNKYISIQQQTTTQDSFGQPSQTWNTVLHCWASIGTVTGQLLYSTAEFVAKATHKITFCWGTDVLIQPNMRIVYVNEALRITRTFNIQALLNENESDMFITALCYELNAPQ